MRFILGTALVVAAVIVAAITFRNPLAEVVIERALASRGLGNPEAEVEALTLRSLEISELTAGTPENQLQIQGAKIGYDLRTLIGQARVERVALRRVRVDLTLAENGTLAIAGAEFPRSGGDGASGLPFEALTVEQSAIRLRTPDGDGILRLSGEFGPAAGGAFRLVAESDGMAMGAHRVERARVDARADLKRDGTLLVSAVITGAGSFAKMSVHEADISADIEARSWRDAVSAGLAQLSGVARLEVRRAEVVSDAEGAFARIGELLGAPQNRATLKGKVVARMGAGAFAIGAEPDDAIVLGLHDGKFLRLAPVEGEALFSDQQDTRKLAAQLQADTAALKGDGRIRLFGAEDGSWRYEASLNVDRYTNNIAALSDGTASLTGALGSSGITGEGDFHTCLSDAVVAGYRVRSACLGGPTALNLNYQDRRASVFNTGTDCISAERISLRNEEQNSRLELHKANFCGSDAPIANFDWGAGLFTLSGKLTAANAEYRIGETQLKGDPPALDIRLIQNADGVRLESSARGGEVLINDFILSSELEAEWTLDVDKEGLTGSATIARVKVAEARDAPNFAPLIGSGAGRLQGDRFLFEYEASTLGEESVGGGEGMHDLKEGRGEITFNARELVFAPGALQPASLAPGLTGIISNARGEANAFFTFAWGRTPDDARSSGEISISDLTFRGPGRAVSRTGGLNGELRLTSLSPLQSDGRQTLRIGLVDLNSLILQNGEVSFELPGDETLRIIEGVFPWFGGEIGVYDATASLAGDRARVPLRATRIDLAEVLGYFDVNGLSGEGILSGVLPLVVEDGKASIVGGEFQSDSPGAIRYVGDASDAAASAGDQAEIAFSILRDLRYSSLYATVNGPLDGRLDIVTRFEGTGEVPFGSGSARLPVKYNVTIDAPLLDLVDQANLTRDIRLQYERARGGQN